jgi:hypothetical protein
MPRSSTEKASRNLDVLGTSGNRGGNGDTPMCRYRLAGPNRTDFPRGMVANRKDKIQLWCAGLGELFRALTAEAGGWQTSSLQLFDSVRIDAAARVAPAL